MQLCCRNILRSKSRWRAIATKEGPMSTIWPSGRGGPTRRKNISSPWASPRIGSRVSVMEKRNLWTPDTTKRLGPKTEEAISLFYLNNRDGAPPEEFLILLGGLLSRRKNCKESFGLKGSS